MTKKTAKTTIDVATLDAQFRHAAGAEEKPEGWTDAGGWIRVSTGAQDEASQVPDIIRDAVAEKLWIAKWYVVHGKSAFKGAQDPDWQKLVTDAKFARIRVAVLWKVDRMDRQNILHAIPMANALLETGAQIRFATQPYITLDTMPGRMAFANLCEMAHEESKIKSERIISKQSLIQAANALTGRPSFGYDTAPRGDGYRMLVPNDIGRKYVPLIFTMIADGWSGLAVAEWLDAEGVKPQYGERWSPRSVLNIIRNQTYIGNRTRRTTGEIVYTGITPLVDEGLWLAANKRIDNAPRGRRGPRNGQSALCTGALECSHCDGAPMYRLAVRSAKMQGRLYEYYRCNGFLPNPQGCGTMVRLAVLDGIVAEAMSASEAPVYEPRFVQGDQPAIQLAIDKINVELRNLPARELSEEQEDAERARLRAERRELEAQLSDAQPDRWVNVQVLKEDGSALTEADRWNAADFAERRRILTSYRITFRWSDVDGNRQPDVTIAPRWAEADEAA